MYKNNSKILLMIIAASAALLFCGCKKETVVGTKTFDVSKTYTIAISQSNNMEALDEIRKGFVVGMKDLGLVEDINVKYVFENANGSDSFAKKIADAFFDVNPDIMIGIGVKSTKALFERNKDSKNKIIFTGVPIPEQLGFSDSKGKPLGYITGVKNSDNENERLSSINESHNNVKKLGIIYNENDVLSKNKVNLYKFYATSKNIDIYTVSIKKADDIDKAIQNIIPKVDAIMLINDDLINTVLNKIAESVKKSGKFLFGESVEHKNAGAEVLDFDKDFQILGKKAAELAKSVLIDKTDIREIIIVEE